MRRETQNILLVLLGGALLKISFTGIYLRYVKPSHQWLLITAGAVMVLLALVSIARELINSGRSTPDEHAHHHSSRGAWLLLLPVLAMFLIAPPALGADSVQRAATTNQTPATNDGTEQFPPLPPGQAPAVPLSDFATRAAWDGGHTLNDRAVTLAGFVVHDNESTYLARLAIACCAADAFPIKVKLDNSPEATATPDDTWLEVVAILKPGTATKNNGYIPAATVTSVRTIPQPDDPYEH